MPLFRQMSEIVSGALGFWNHQIYTVRLILQALLASYILLTLNHSIADIIEQARLDAIKALLAPLHNIIQRLITNHRSMCTAKDAAIEAFCMTSMLGAGIQWLHRVGLWPIPQPEEILWSVLDLSIKLYRVEIWSIDPYSQDDSAHQCSHGEALKAEIDKVIDSLPSLVTEEHERHLDSQAKKSGVSTI